MILETIKTSFLLTISMIGIFVLFGMVYNFIEKRNSSYIQATFGFKGILITGIIGTTIHELSHYLMALIFRHKIGEVKLFRPRAAKIDGVLGFVEHRYDKRSLYQRIGNFFIGIAPIIFGTIAISISFKLLLPEIFSKLNISEYIDLISIMVFNNYDEKKEYSLKKEEYRYKRFLGEDIVYTRSSFQDFAKNPIKYLNN